MIAETRASTKYNKKTDYAVGTHTHIILYIYTGYKHTR